MHPPAEIVVAPSPLQAVRAGTDRIWAAIAHLPPEQQLISLQRAAARYAERQLPDVDPAYYASAFADGLADTLRFNRAFDAPFAP